jgi:hypothetical protein
MNDVFTRAFEQVILEYDLIDTGALYESIIVEADLNGWQLVINIQCEDYVKYHVEKGLVDSFLNRSEVNTEITRIYQEKIEGVIESVLAGGVFEEPSFDVNILINGE